MKGYAHMSKESVISLAGKAIEAILKERELQIKENLNSYKTDSALAFAREIKSKPVFNLSYEEIIIAQKWDNYFLQLSLYGEDMISNLKQLIKAAQVAEGYMLVAVEMASAMHLWSGE